MSKIRIPVDITYKTIRVKQLDGTYRNYVVPDFKLAKNKYRKKV